MTKVEYMMALQQAFARMRYEDQLEIMEAYEEHFQMGRERGLTDAQIMDALGAPQEIYQAYVEEGLVTESTTGAATTNLEGILGKLSDSIAPAYEKAKARFQHDVQPQLPGIVRATSKTLVWVGRTLSYVTGVLIWMVTSVLVYLLSISWQPFTNLPALPPTSWVTLLGFAGTGFFAGLACFAIGNVLGQIGKERGNI